MSLEAILFLALAWLGANLFDSNFISPYLGQTKGTLFFHISALVGWIVFWFLGRHNEKKHQRRQFWFTLGFLCVFVGSAFFQQLHVRSSSGQPIGIHDGAVHVEVAAKKLLRGQNPYQADYRGTEYEILNPRIPSGPNINVVWSHFIYPPAVFLLQAVWQFFGSIIGVTPDARWIFMIGLAVVTWIVVTLQTDWKYRTRMLLLTAGNPLLWLYVVAGYNDILIVAALGLVAWAYQRQRWIVAGAMFGLALGLKQSAWMIAPLFAWLIWTEWRLNRAGAMRMLLAGGIAVGAIFLPFVFWNAPALFDDTVRYASGSIPYSYPISGATLMQYIRVWGLVDSPWAIIPAIWAQLVVGIIVTISALRWLGRKPHAGSWLAAVSIVTTAVLLVSRYNNNNYLSAIIGLGILAYAFQLETKRVE